MQELTMFEQNMSEMHVSSAFIHSLVKNIFKLDDSFSPHW
jgi:hypothetical protein